ncbi:hypothetical protein BS47DRAFT_1401047 [Hydnum rufescens UP504]|uniref:Uncharacterized protein n=1 Tax=Hydnum rufescens UP504 TaxID=1448309 RepID=A0A9P6DJT4_9AGAM|nr:hypothetical protein BS47DRAFT_1401047 [Hydnum rufescens UP504]
MVVKHSVQRIRFQFLNVVSVRGIADGNSFQAHKIGLKQEYGPGNDIENDETNDRLTVRRHQALSPNGPRVIHRALDVQYYPNAHEIEPRQKPGFRSSIRSTVRYSMLMVTQETGTHTFRPVPSLGPGLTVKETVCPGKEEHEIRTLWSIVLLVVNPSSGPYNGTAKCLHWDGHTLVYCTSGPQTHQYNPWEPEKPLVSLVKGFRTSEGNGLRKLLNTVTSICTTVPCHANAHIGLRLSAVVELPYNMTGSVGVYMTAELLLANGSEAMDPQCDVTQPIKTPMTRRVGIGTISGNSSPEPYLGRAPKLEPVAQDHTDAHENGFRWKPGLGPSPRSSETTGLPYNATSPDETKECCYNMLRDLAKFLLPPVEDTEGEDPEPGMSRMVRFESGSHQNDAVLPPPQGDMIQRKGLLPSSLTSTQGNYSKLTERWLDSAIFHRRFLDAYLVTAMNVLRADLFQRSAPRILNQTTQEPEAQRSVLPSSRNVETPASNPGQGLGQEPTAKRTALVKEISSKGMTYTSVYGEDAIPKECKQETSTCYIARRPYGNANLGEFNLSPNPYSHIARHAHGMDILVRTVSSTPNLPTSSMGAMRPIPDLAGGSRMPKGENCSSYARPTRRCYQHLILSRSKGTGASQGTNVTNEVVEYEMYDYCTCIVRQQHRVPTPSLVSKDLRVSSTQDVSSVTQGAPTLIFETA